LVTSVIGSSERLPRNCKNFVRLLQFDRFQTLAINAM
jgi:hypothetical protein